MWHQVDLLEHSRHLIFAATVERLSIGRARVCARITRVTTGILLRRSAHAAPDHQHTGEGRERGRDVSPLRAR
jgi:hypothetical protein